MVLRRRNETLENKNVWQSVAATILFSKVLFRLDETTTFCVEELREDSGWARKLHTSHSPQPTATATAEIEPK